MCPSDSEGPTTSRKSPLPATEPRSLKQQEAKCRSPCMRFFTLGDQSLQGTHTMADPSPRFWQQCPATQVSFRHRLYWTPFSSQFLTQISPLGGILQCSLTLASQCNAMFLMGCCWQALCTAYLHRQEFLWLQGMARIMLGALDSHCTFLGATCTK